LVAGGAWLARLSGGHPQSGVRVGGGGGGGPDPCTGLGTAARHAQHGSCVRAGGGSRRPDLLRLREGRVEEPRFDLISGPVVRVVHERRTQPAKVQLVPASARSASEHLFEMKLAIVPVTPFQQNCSLLLCEETGKGAVVDPGGDLDRILDVARKHAIVLEKIFLTHGHIDHCGGTAELSERLGLPVEGPQREDRFWIDQLPTQSRMFGFPPLRAFTPDRWLEGG